MNPSTPAPKPQRARRWPKRLAIGGAVSVLLLVVLYFVATSAAFLKGVILPRVGKSMNATVTVGDASISPFSQVVLRDLKVATTGTEPVVELRELRARYSLWSIIRGNILVDEITVDSPTIRLVRNADGTSNLDPLLQGGAETPTAEQPPAKSAPPKLALHNIAVKNGSVRVASALPGGGSEVTEISGFQFALDQVVNGQASKLTVGADFSYSHPTNGTARAKAAGDLAFTLDADLNPQTAKGGIRIDVPTATASLAQAAGAALALDCDLSSTELRQIALRFTRAGQPLGEVRLAGPFNAAKGEAALKLQAGPFDKQLLNLLAAGSGMDFGSTRIQAGSELTLGRQWQQVAVKGNVAIDQFSVSKPGQTTPQLNLALGWDLSADTAAHNATLRTFDLTGTQAGKQILRGGLSQPMTIGWGGAAAQAGDARLQVQVADFDFALWRSVLGPSLSAGLLQLNVNLSSLQGGKQLTFDVGGGIRGLTVSNSIPALQGGDLTIQCKGDLTDFTKTRVESLDLDLSHRQKTAFKLHGAAQHDGVSFSSRKRVELNPFTLLGQGPATNLAFSSSLEGRYQSNILHLSRAVLDLPATTLAPSNTVVVSVMADLSRQDLTRTKINISSPALDLTPLYDAFAGSTSSPTAKAPPAQPAPAPAPGPEQEPDAQKIPLELDFQAQVERFFLREIAASNIVTTARLVDNRFVLDPFKLTMNGAPLTARADVNLGVKGYTYDVSFGADRLPLEPIANTFSPAYRGQYKGFILANTAIKGAGITGPSIQKNLNGQLGFSFTNADIQIVGPKTRSLLVPIASLLRLDALLSTPLNFVTSQIDIGAGQAKLSRFTVQSGAFEASSQGTIPLATNLNLSPLNLPVNFSLRRSLAEKSNLVPPNAPTNTPYVLLPDFVKLIGNVGQPSAELNKTVVAGLLVKSGTGIAEKLGVKVDDKTSGVIQGVGNLLTGQPSKDAAAATNAPPSTNKPVNPLDLFRKPKK